MIALGLASLGQLNCQGLSSIRGFQRGEKFD